MIEEIKACPFCGCSSSLIELNGKFWVFCDDNVSCGLNDGHGFDSASDAIERWNSHQ